ncbi:cobyrinate a,c-diamide synthase [Stagnihabitans tardus]|uniref:Hydrogenobyrinate a,c-diamide synthase n=1 Tax=Stagnihabitans tardus TaxID=2699202 RepID=A0AAE5BUC1_9RHOB|nr:cobyrinate a,c-diamide synthase [Stagnihabitans tardus]NBZ85953.1 cobyrinate a,c-diamide synthase [Stagnihabitans tardus]
MKGFLISAPSSGSGKTLVTLGISRALRRRGLAVQCFKSGPDYIDPAFHRAATGRASFNLDTWAMGRPMIEALLTEAQGADVVVAEGSMGLHDGVAQAGAFGRGASADLAMALNWPVVLVVDVSGQAQTCGAVALGCQAFRRGLRLAGVILNKVASPRHERLARAGVEAAGLAVLGALPRRKGAEVPERHLGLVQAEELPELEAVLEAAADLVETHVDLDAILAASAPVTGQGALRLAPPGQRIALARDEAFSFIYPHLLSGWRAAGAEILTFSPLADQAPPQADVCWLPGGYPELHGPRLASATRFMAGLRGFAGPIHGECGGYMVLGEALVDAQGVSHPMAGLLGLVTSFEKRKMHLGYRLAEIENPPPGLAARCRGHEFHYSNIVAQPDEPLAKVMDADGQPVAETGSRRGRVTGTYFHMIAEA